MKRIIALSALCYLILVGCGLAQSERSLVIEKLTLGLGSANGIERVNSAKFIFNFKLKDQVLHKRVAVILNDGYQQEATVGHIQEMSWMCKALAVSGDLQYIELLKEIVLKTSSEELRSHAMESAGLIYESQKSLPLNTKESFNEKQNQLIYMLRSDDLTLRRTAAKIMTQNVGVYDSVYAVAEETLLVMVDYFRAENLYVDTMAWLCKALASSGDSQYVEVLKQVYSKTQNKKLQSYTTKAIRSFAISPDKLTQGNSFFDKYSGITWYLAPEAGEADYDTAKRVCSSLEINGYKKGRLPTLYEFKQLWRKNKDNKSIEIFKKKEYVSNDVEADGTNILILAFSFRMGDSDVSYAANIVCVEK